MTEVVGKPELTPYKGGWAGNELFAGAFSEKVLAKTRDWPPALATSCARKAITAISTSISSSMRTTKTISASSIRAYPAQAR